MCDKKNKWHPEALSQGRLARLDGRTLDTNPFPKGWLWDSFVAGWWEIHNDQNAPKTEIS